MRGWVVFTIVGACACVRGLVGCASVECANDALCALNGMHDAGTDANDSNAGTGDGSGIEGGSGDSDAWTLDGPTGGDGSDAGDSALEAGVACDSSSLCSGQCVDLTQPAHCGSCMNACSPPASGKGSATCSPPMACGVRCETGYHACNGDCLPDTDLPSNASDPCVLSEMFGVFVSTAGSDNNAGTMASPVATLGHAMDLAKAAGKRVYACGGTYASENLVVGASRDGVSAYSGLDCSVMPWTYNASKVATVAPTAAGYALRVTGLSTGVSFEDFGFVAQPGAAAGDSSIAVFISGPSHVVLRRCAVQAAGGAPGADPSPLGPAAPAPSGNPGTLGSGGDAKPNPACTMSIGGAGGPPSSNDGGQNGNDGKDGQPGAPNHGSAAAQDCGNGSSGKNGSTGSVGGSGAGASSWAALSASGWTPSAGEPGVPGAVGQGGGGGASLDSSGGGGSGGAGGCGGTGGAAGTGGGSSIALLAYQSSVDLEACTLQAASAGRGGNGAAGQVGQARGLHGNGFGAACPGGNGGVGGSGGPGGGGAGGLSAGVIWSGTAPTISGASVPTATTLPNVSLGALGASGKDGAGSSTGTGSGKPGIAQAVVQLQ